MSKKRDVDCTYLCVGGNVSLRERKRERERERERMEGTM